MTAFKLLWNGNHHSLEDELNLLNHKVDKIVKWQFYTDNEFYYVMVEYEPKQEESEQWSLQQVK